MSVHVTVLKERGVLVLAPTDKERQISPPENFPPCESRLSVFRHCVPCRSLTFALFHATVGNFSGEFQAGLSRSHLEGEREDTKACFPFPAQEDRAAGELPLCVRIHVGKSFPPTRLLPPLVDLVTKPRKSFGAFLGSVL